MVSGLGLGGGARGCRGNGCCAKSPIAGEIRVMADKDKQGTSQLLGQVAPL